MNILIIDDDIVKTEIIKANLKSIDETANIRWFNNYQDAMLFINNNQDYIDLIMLDWCFPANSYSRSKYGMGRQILTSMLYSDINIKTIICSADVVIINPEEFPFVAGSIVMCGGLNLKRQIEGFIYDTPVVEEAPQRKLKINKPDTNSGYKRRMSSTPWWKK